MSLLRPIPPDQSEACLDPRPALPEPFAPGEIHVWEIDLERPREDVLRLERLLPPAEARRAARQPFEARRRDLVLSGVALRAILASYLELDPRRLRFVVDPGGKPRLEPRSGRDPLTFNLSHSRGRALVVVAPGGEVGIDLERFRRDLPVERLAARFFAPREIAALRSISEDVRHAAFFACWTRKEAFVKATGAGIFRQPLRSFAVSVDPRSGPVRLEIPGHEDEARRWRLVSIDAGPGYAAAVASEGPFRVRRYRWDG